MYDDDFEDETPAFTNPSRFTLRRKNLNAPTTEVDLENLMPGENEELPAYNPFKYAYAMVLDELNMEIVVQFGTDDADYSEKDPLVFKTKDGTEITVPFFPRVQEGVPVESTQQGGEIYYNFREGERKLSIYPMIVRAKVFGDGLEKPDVLVSQKVLREMVSAERLEAALVQFYADTKADPAAPAALLDVLADVTGQAWAGDGIDDDEDSWDDEWEDEEEDGFWNPSAPVENDDLADDEDDDLSDDDLGRNV